MNVWHRPTVVSRMSEHPFDGLTREYSFPARQDCQPQQQMLCKTE